MSLGRRPASSDLVVKDQAPDQSQDQLQVSVQNVFRTCDKTERILCNKHDGYTAKSVRISVSRVSKQVVYSQNNMLLTAKFVIFYVL